MAKVKFARFNCIATCVCLLATSQLRADSRSPRILDLPVLTLVEKLQHGDESERLDAAFTFSSIANKDPMKLIKIIPMLRAALGSEDGYVQVYCAYALASMNKEHELVLKTLTVLLRDERVGLQLHAMLALGEQRSLVRAAATEVVARIEDTDPNVQVAAIKNLQHLGPFERDIAEKLLKIANSEEVSSGIRAAAVRALSDCSRADWAHVIDSMRTFDKDETIDVLEAKAIMLGRVGAGAEKAVAQLLEMSKDPRSRLAANAITGLAELKYPADKLLPVIRKLLDRPSRIERQACLIALTKYGVSLKDALPDAVLLLDDPDVRSFALNFLSSLGTHADSALPKLKEMKLKYMDERLLKQIESTIMTIRSGK